jgi:hypothetical protein
MTLGRILFVIIHFKFSPYLRNRVWVEHNWPLCLAELFSLALACNLQRTQLLFFFGLGPYLTENTVCIIKTWHKDTLDLYKMPIVFFPCFNQIWIFSEDFSGSPEYKRSRISFQWEQSSSLRTDRYNDERVLVWPVLAWPALTAPDKPSILGRLSQAHSPYCPARITICPSDTAVRHVPHDYVARVE